MPCHGDGGARGGVPLTIAASYRVRLDANNAYASARDAQVGFVRNLAWSWRRRTSGSTRSARLHAPEPPQHVGRARHAGTGASLTAWGGPRTSPTPRSTFRRMKQRGSRPVARRRRRRRRPGPHRGASGDPVTRVSAERPSTRVPVPAASGPVSADTRSEADCSAACDPRHSAPPSPVRILAWAAPRSP